MGIRSYIEFLSTNNYLYILYHFTIIYTTNNVMNNIFFRNIKLRVCFWSNTGGAQLVETNIKCFSSTTSATATTSAITNTSIYVWIYLYLNNIK